MWSKDADRGHVDHVTFSNVTSAAPTRKPRPPADLLGFDAEHRVERTRFDHVVVDNHPLRSEDVRTNAFVDGVKIEP